uniref:Ankyrin repeat and LEM domain-containing protein 2 n=1 Tax=Tetraodon nigroviridis TaxID=99883 RepID=H3DH74_TETNG
SMEATLTRLGSLTADELREEFARAGVKCGPITPTTRATFERKLARVLAGTANTSAEHDSSASVDISDSSNSTAGHTSVGAVSPAFAAASRKLTEKGYEDVDFGYGVGLNPPDEEEVSEKSSKSFTEVSNSQNITETPSKQTQVSPTLYYGVCPPWHDVLARSERAHVFTDRKDALQAVKTMKGARFKAFSIREDAEKFARGICDYFLSPSKTVSCVSPAKPGTVLSKGGLISPKDNMEVDTINRERANSFKSPRTQDLTAKLRKAVEKGDREAFSELVWTNPRYLIGSGDNPTIVQEGCRYNVMHVAAKENQAGIAQLLLDTLENPDFMRLMYPDDQEGMLQKRIHYIVDLYLNTPDKAGFETPLHFACKFGCPDVVNVLCSHPDIDKSCRNKDGQRPCDLICSRKNKTHEVKQKIAEFLEDRFYIPLLRATDNSSQPVIGALWSPESSERLLLLPQHGRSPIDPVMAVSAFAGPLSPSKADDFRRSWKTPPREQAQHIHNILKSDPDRGAERVGRDLARGMGAPWAEFWDFLDSFVDLSSTEGLRKLEEYLSKRDFSPQSHEDTGENESSNRFRTPSPGKHKKFCNSISVGAFLEEGDDISLEEMKNRQNAALTSITFSAGSKDGLKGAVGGRESHILPIARHHHGADLIETAAEQGLLCCCSDSLLSPGNTCKNCASSSRDRTHNGDKMAPRTPPSSSTMLSPVSNLLVEFERMSLEETLDSPSSCRERKSSGGNRHRESWDAYGSASATDLGLHRFSLGHSPPERRSSGTSYKSLYHSNELFSRTPPHARRGLFILGSSPTKLDQEVLLAIEGVDIDPQMYPSIQKWKSTIKTYSPSDMKSWPSPAVVKSRLRMQTPGSPVSGLMSPSGRFSPARHAPSPDFSPSRYSPANASYIQRIRLKHLNEP